MTRGRRTSSRSVAEEQPSTSSAPPPPPAPTTTPAAAASEPTATGSVEKETKPEDVEMVDVAEEAGAVDARIAYICSIFLAENRDVRDKLATGSGPMVSEDDPQESRELPIVEQIQRVEQIVLSDTLESVLKDPKYAILADLTIPVEAPEAATSRAMDPIEVKIEESEATVPSASVLPSASGGETNVERAAKRNRKIPQD
uniref:Uncharacterized protein n=1 Tax=Caenorhabditis japonica TaxID=281687 RepID=A0A8R1J0N0_CAEJA